MGESERLPALYSTVPPSILSTLENRGPELTGNVRICLQSTVLLKYPLPNPHHPSPPPLHGPQYSSSSSASSSRGPPTCKLWFSSTKIQTPTHIYYRYPTPTLPEQANTSTQNDKPLQHKTMHDLQGAT